MFFPVAGISTVLLFTALTLYLIKRDSDVSLKQNKFIFMMLCIYVLSTMQALYIPGVIEALEFWIAKGALYYLLINVIVEERDFKHTVWTIVLATSAMMSWAWDLYLNHFALLGDGRIRGFGEYNEANGLGLLLTMVWPLAFFLFESERGTAKKAFLVAFMIASFITVAYTKSRGSLMGFGTAIALCIIFSRGVFRSRPVKTCVMACLYLALTAFAVRVVFTRAGVNSFGDDDWSAQNRVMAWHAAIRMAISHPLLGVGWGRFTDHCFEYGMDKVLIAHNTPLSVAAETGFFGLFAYLSYMFVTLKELFTIRRSIEPAAKHRYIYNFACGALIGLFSLNINSTFSVKDHYQALWILLGLAGAVCAAYARAIKQEEEGTEDGEISEC